MTRRTLVDGPWSVVRGPWSPKQRTTDDGRRTSFRGFTLVEMLIAMAITLVMIGAVVTLFANISNSVRNRRAVVEISGQLRHARNMLQKDLQGATCPGLTWQRPEDNVGYIEIIEGLAREGQASVLIDGVDNSDPSAANYNPEIDHTTSILPASNAPFKDVAGQSNWDTDGASLGDHDDILMLTVRNEHEPFVGRVPNSSVRINESTENPSNPSSGHIDSIESFGTWRSQSIESPLAEVVWYSIENPADSQDPAQFFGEPGLRTIYRRALLIAPWLNPYRYVNPQTGNVVDTFQTAGSSTQMKAVPGLLRVLPGNISREDVNIAIACLIAFQERFDISARLEFDPLMDPNTDGRWKIVANTLADLTKRENRYGHIGYGYDNVNSEFTRNYPYPMVSIGLNQTNDSLVLTTDPEVAAPATPAEVTAKISGGNATNYLIEETGINYRVPPFVFSPQQIPHQATARAMLGDDGKVVRVIHGPVPLSRDRRGEDVMLTDALGFDLRVYDPGAPLFQHVLTDTVIDPTDPSWLGWPEDVIGAYMDEDNMMPNGTGRIDSGNYDGNSKFRFVGQGSYVDLGYGYDARADRFSTSRPYQLPPPRYGGAFSAAIDPWFFNYRPLLDVYGDLLAPGFSVYDTWSFHYENNGANEDKDSPLSSTNPLIDEGTNGLDDPGHYFDSSGNSVYDIRLGPDDIGERETRPPYDRPLRGVQVLLRLYERDSRQIRQVTVNQNFVPE